VWFGSGLSRIAGTPRAATWVVQLFTTVFESPDSPNRALVLSSRKNATAKPSKRPTLPHLRCKWKCDYGPHKQHEYPEIWPINFKYLVGIGSTFAQCPKVSAISNTMSTISLRENVNKLGGWGDFPEIEIPHRVTSYGLRVTNWRSAFSATDHWEYVGNLWIAPHCKHCPNSWIEITNIACNRSKQTLDTPASGAEGSGEPSWKISIWHGAHGPCFFVGRTCFGIINQLMSGVQPFMYFWTHFHTFRRPVIWILYERSSLEIIEKREAWPLGHY